MNQDVLQTIFTVLGILYSVLLSSVVSFTYGDVLNMHYRKRISKRLRTITVKSSFHFVISAFVFVFYQVDFFQMSNFGTLIENIIVVGFLVYCILYYVFTFITLQKLRIQISDEVLEEKRQLGQL